MAELIDWRAPDTIDSLARTAIRSRDRGAANVALAAIVIPGVLERIVEIERTKGVNDGE